MPTPAAGNAGGRLRLAAWVRIAAMTLTQRLPPPPAPRRRTPFALRGVKALAIGGGLSAVFAFVFGQRLAQTMVYSLSITLGCWFFIDGGRLLAARWVNRKLPADVPYRSEWPGWGWMLAILLAGTALGASFGLWLGDLVLGGRDALSYMLQPRQLGALLVFSLIPGLVATVFFHHRGRMAAIEAQAQQARREAAETQLRLLESQLEPHMLFNTLANLRVLIALDPPRAQTMLDQLIGFLRATLNASRVGRHALSAEFSRLSDYLALMQVRMGARLQVALTLPDDLAGAAVPPLLLQPLVENAIKHGLEPQVDGGRIEITARRDGATLVLSVRDTGVGLAAAPADGTRFGLQQVRDRLATLYGDAASLTLAPADGGGGALATVRLPYEPTTSA